MRPIQLSVDLDAIEHNLNVVRGICGNATNIVSCIKANAYGHGIIPVAKQLQRITDMFGVASLDEALQLRQQGISTPCLLLEGCFDEQEWQQSIQQGCIPVIHSMQQWQWLKSNRAQYLENNLPIWIKIDTGMHRLGFVADDRQALLTEIQQHQQHHTQQQWVLMSHFSSAEIADSDITQQQWAELQQFSEQLTQRSICHQISAANSAAIMSHPYALAEWVRPGYMLYGGNHLHAQNPFSQQLKTASRLTSSIISVKQIKAGSYVGYNQCWQAQKDSCIAVIAAGYGDGYPRNSSNGTPVWIEKYAAEAPVVGRVSMDMITIDISHLPPLYPGDTVELWGPNLSIDKVAKANFMSGYELMTRLPQRLTDQTIYQDINK